AWTDRSPSALHRQHARPGIARPLGDDAREVRQGIPARISPRARRTVRGEARGGDGDRESAKRDRVMGKTTGFMELERVQEVALPVAKRVRNYREFILTLKDDEAARQGARCMDCGIPFCQSGCPINNIIPDWN